MPRFHHQRFSDEHHGETALVCAVLENMDPKNIPFIALIVGSTNSGRSQYLVRQLRGPFRGKFDHMVLICPTSVHKKKPTTGLWITIREIFVINCQQEEVELWLKLNSYFFQVTNTLIVLDDCAPSKDVKGRTGQLVSLGCSARHAGISVRVLTQQITNISNHSVKTWLPSFCFTPRRAKP